MSFGTEVEDSTDSVPKQINKVLVWISGKITNNADRQIVRADRREYNNVTFIDGEKTIEYIDEYFPDYWTLRDATISAYFKNAEERYSKLEELQTLGNVGEIKRLPTVFVSPTLELVERVRSKQAQQEGLPPKRYKFSRLLQTTRQHTALIGPMGTGKSTILRRLLMEIIRQNREKLRIYPIPIYVRLQTIGFEIDKEPDDGALEIKKALQKEFDEHHYEAENVELEEALTNGNIVVLLDGFDELEKPELIEYAFDSVIKFIDKYGRSRVVISSRPIEYFNRAGIFTHFKVYKIRNFDFSQTQDLIRNWFQEDSRKGEELIKLLSQPITFTSLPLTPLTLALIAILYGNGIHELPSNTTELFEKYTEIALGRWDSDKGLDLQVEWRIKQFILGHLAWKIQIEGNRGLSRQDLENQIQEVSQERGLPLDTSVLMRELVERSGLLFRNSENAFEFKHKSFLDYFAGNQLSKQANIDDLLKKHFMNPGWSRVIFFAFGLTRGENNYLSAVQNFDVPNGGHFHYALQMGLVTQASYLASNEQKIDAINRSLYAFIKGWNEFAEQLIKQSEENGRRAPSHMLLLDFFTAFAIVALGSKTLAPALDQIASECLDRQLIDNASPESQVQTDWYRYFLAIGSLYSGNIHRFIEIASSNMILDPSLLQLLLDHAEDVNSEPLLTANQKDLMTEVVKKLRKKLKSSSDLLHSINSNAPRILAIPEVTE